MAEATPAPLTERDRAVLAFERQWWKYAGAKEEAIRRQFGISPTAYYQLLSRLIDEPAALAADATLVKRLQRQRAARRRRRAARIPAPAAEPAGAPSGPMAERGSGEEALLTAAEEAAGPGSGALAPG
jgi:Protein of unknown function (DUF3263)